MSCNIDQNCYNDFSRHGKEKANAGFSGSVFPTSACTFWLLCSTLEGGRCRGRQKKCWMDNVKMWMPLPMPELLTTASRRKKKKNWKRISVESFLMSRPTAHFSFRTELNWYSSRWKPKESYLAFIGFQVFIIYVQQGGKTILRAVNDCPYRQAFVFAFFGPTSTQYKRPASSSPIHFPHTHRKVQLEVYQLCCLGTKTQFPCPVFLSL